VWISFGRLGGVLDDRDDASWGVIGRMNAGVTIEAVRAELAAIGQDIGREHPQQGVRKFWVNLLRDQTVGDAGAQLWMLLAAVSVLLMIACANVANLFLVRATERTREMAIRAAMGAGRGRVARQLIAEGTILALAGGGIGAGPRVCRHRRVSRVCAGRFTTDRGHRRGRARARREHRDLGAIGVALRSGAGARRVAHPAFRRTARRRGARHAWPAADDAA
jgi:hypothetical protein